MTKKLKLTESTYILKEKEDIYDVIFTSTRRIKKFKVDNLVKEVIDKLNSEEDHDIRSLTKELSGDYKPKQVFSCINSLEREGVIKEYGDTQIDEKYNNQLLFIDELTNSWDETLELQEKINQSKIGVFGVGGIGTWIVNGLSQIGIGEIKISDPDTIERSNLNRQLFFDSSDVGDYKVDVIKSKVKDSKIRTFKKFVSKKENLEEIVFDLDFIVNCADSPSIADTTKIVDEYATKYNVPYSVAGGYNLHLGMVGPIIVPGKTATFEDFLEYQKSQDPFNDLIKIKDISKTGNLGPIAGAVSNIQVMEIFKYLIGKGTLNLNRFAEIDFMNFNVSWREFANKGKSKN